ncbi:MAG: inorganic pyrophosphatase [Melioribacteraceae bacterium]|nr:inorganic pyrophosphatase [Melioribacteraceae bacterium]MCO6474608.1 inorganic pyrophosphatase [Melioribacteraceae bacterium]MDD3557597.1 inorganic pyrophosphatase [Melioribacteraceae bacterium]
MSFPKSFYRWRPHPWHGLKTGEKTPEIVNAYIEMTPFDLVKYEVDKKTGYVHVDRPQRSSSHPPALYGFIPRTYCGERTGELNKKAGRGDGDPLDICVISERPIARGEIIVRAKVVGGLQGTDHGEADDKIIAVLANDNIYGDTNDISDLPSVLVERIRHYFLTYKLIPGEENKFSIEKIYGKDDAFKVINAAVKDYEEVYGGD